MHVLRLHACLRMGRYRACSGGRRAGQDAARVQHLCGGAPRQRPPVVLLDTQVRPPAPLTVYPLSDLQIGWLVQLADPHLAA